MNELLEKFVKERALKCLLIRHGVKINPEDYNFEYRNFAGGVSCIFTNIVNEYHIPILNKELFMSDEEYEDHLKNEIEVGVRQSLLNDLKAVFRKYPNVHLYIHTGGTQQKIWLEMMHLSSTYRLSEPQLLGGDEENSFANIEQLLDESRLSTVPDTMNR